MAGVSRTAVSFVLNGRAEGNISAATAERVRAVAAELGYTPDRVAQSLRLQRTNIIGLVTDGIASSPFAGRILSGAIERAHQSGFVVVVSDSAGSSEREQEAVEEYSRRRVDGLLYASMRMRELAHPPTTTLPLVLANCTARTGEHVGVVPDNTDGGRAAARHLLELGHRRMVMLGGPGDVAGEQRVSGFRSALAEIGLAGLPAPVIDIGRMWSIDVGYHATIRTFTDDQGRLLTREARPTGVFAINDRVATGAMLALGHLGLSVPRDVSIIGFDDQEQLAAHVVPALTTVALPFWAIGEIAVDRLLGSLGSPDAARMSIALPCPLVARQSSGPPPG